MRVLAALAALILLTGCDPAAAPAGPQQKDSSEVARDAEAFANSGSGFDYRYAFRLPGNRLKGVLQSNADGCDRLGPTRCRITAMRYKVGDANHIRAVLTIQIDPAIARRFGDAVSDTVNRADGVLIDTEASGADASSAVRSMSLISRLREQLRSAETQAAAGDATATARAQRLQATLDTIAEVEAGQGQTLATAPVLITYESSTAIAGLGSADANFRNAGQTFENTLAQLLTVLASVGPWLLVMIALVLVLRWIVHGRAVPEAEGGHAVPVDQDDVHHDNRNLIQRWFSRDDEEEGHRN